MGLASMPLFAALTEKMRWHQARQTVLAENVANAETPGYRARDLKEPTFAEALGRGATPVAMATTASHHIVATNAGSAGFAAQRAGSYEISQKGGDYEVTPEGNGVVLEDEMMKVTANQMDYQTITTLY